MVETATGSESESPISREKEILSREETFFASHDKGNYVGILTNYNVSTVSRLYPEIVSGMMLFYGFVEKDESDPLSEEAFLNRHIRNLYATGTLLTNEQVTKLREDVQSGAYSDQYEIYRKRQASLSSPSAKESNRNQRFDAYKAIAKEEDVVFNKRACLARIQGLRSDLMALHGQVNYQQALLAELLLAAPFSASAPSEIDVDDDLDDDTVPIPSARIDEGTIGSQRAYFEEIVEFAKSIDFDKRVETFEKESDKYQVRWTPEQSPFNIPPFDKKYISKVYELAGKMLDGTYSLGEVHDLLSQTILRRGKTFKVVIHETPFGVTTQIIPEELQTVPFENIAGYDDQKNFLKALIAKTEERSSTLDEMRIVISAGKPGLGKSLGVRAFLSNLPENARGLILNINPNTSRRGEIVDIKSVARVASYHPDLHIFAIVEDIDAIAGNRLAVASTSEFLQIDSTDSDSYPPNLHIFATTNRPDVIDPAVTRPGRTAKILVYEEPNDETRGEIIRYHSEQNDYHLQDELIAQVVEKSKGLTPDEIRYLFWSLRFEDIEEASIEAIDKYITDVKSRWKIKKEAKKTFEE